MDPMTWMSVIGAGVGMFDSLFGGGNPNEWAKGAAEDYDRQAQEWLNPNNQFYSKARAGYYRDLSKSLGASVPQTGSLLSMTGRLQGGAYGGSVLQANLLRQKGMTEAFDTAGASTERFGNSLYEQGLGQYQNLKNLGGQMRQIYGGGQVEAQQYRGSFNNALTGSGLGYLGQYGDFGGVGDWFSGLLGPNNQYGGPSGGGRRRRFV